jgi:helix-turn-helix protein
VNIGGALAEARSGAGLTITEVSKRTRIREGIIRDIESNDYSACGGDFYARGHIRAIARVVGADPVPLIKEYDAAQLPLEQEVANHAGPHGAAANGSAANGSAADAGPDAETSDEPLDGATSGLPATVWDSARRRAAARKQAGRPAAAYVPAYSPPGITAAEAFRPGLPMDFERRRPRGMGLLVLLVLALIGVVIYLLVSRSSPTGHAPATPPRSHHSAAAAARRTASPSITASTPAKPAAVPLKIATAAAFGPAGTSQGDDPQSASLAIDGSAATSWTSDWYATAHLGGLQSGTGLLLNLGNAATITSGTVVLGSMPGGRLELRAGSTPILADLPVVATSANPGGTLTMRLTVPARARYALLWFTSLPPDGTGTYQVHVYDIRLMGNPA